MPLEALAVYEDGMLKLLHPLPLAEHQRVRIVIEEQLSITEQIYGIIGWTGDGETLRKIALDPEFGIHESP